MTTKMALCAALLLTLAATAARADVITTYTFSGTTTDFGGTITGSFQIDQTTYDYNTNKGYVAGSSTIMVSGDSIAGVNGLYDLFQGFLGGSIDFENSAHSIFTFPIGGNPPIQTGSISVAAAYISTADGEYSTVTGGDLIASTPTTGVPEPSTWAMMLIGFAGLGFAGYRRASKARAIAA